MSTTNPKDTLTEWDALQIKHGNYEAPPKEKTEVEATAEAVEIAIEAGRNRDEALLANGQRLDGSDDEDELTLIRKKRLEEMKMAKARWIYNTVYNLGRADFVAEVTEASRRVPGSVIADNCEDTSDETGESSTNGTWVVVLLYEDHSESCHKMISALEELARMNGDVKFVKGKAKEIVAELPDTSLPGILLYYGGVCRHQIFGLNDWVNIKGKTTEDERVKALSAETVEAILSSKYKVIPASRISDRARERRINAREENPDDEDPSAKDEKGYADIELDHLMSRKR